MTSIERLYVWQEPLSFQECPKILALDDNPSISERVENIKKKALASMHKEIAVLGWEILITYPTENATGSLGVRYLLFGKQEWFAGLDGTY